MSCGISWKVCSVAKVILIVGCQTQVANRSRVPNTCWRSQALTCVQLWVVLSGSSASRYHLCQFLSVLSVSFLSFILSDRRAYFISPRRGFCLRDVNKLCLRWLAMPLLGWCRAGVFGMLRWGCDPPLGRRGNRIQALLP